MAKRGDAAGIDTQTMHRIVGFALSNVGLMANLSLDGTKIQSDRLVILVGLPRQGDLCHSSDTACLNGVEAPKLIFSMCR